MKISYNWIQSYIAEPLPEPAELAEKIIFGAFEVEEIKVFGDDTVFEIKTLPDRNHDCLSHQGIAREIAGLLGLTFRDMTPFYTVPVSVPTKLKLDIQTSDCHRYMARVVRGITVGPSHDWVVKHLTSIGIPSINNIVDAYTIVMYDCGQPCFISDLKKHSDQNLNITNLMYPYDSAVDESTTDIIIHSANFDAIAVRKNAKKMGIDFEVAKRYENEITPELASFAMLEISALIAEMCPDAVFEEIVDVYPNPVGQRHVSFTTKYINARLGSRITVAEIETILNNYGYEYALDGETFTVAIPFNRIDITGAYDMVEEIGRVYGYNTIDAVLPDLKAEPLSPSDSSPKVGEPNLRLNDSVYTKIQTIKTDLISQGYHEVMNYSFTKRGDYDVARGPVGKSALRTNLSDGLKLSYEMNRLNKDLLEIDDMKVFEIGTVFQSSGETINVAYIDKQGITETSISEYIVHDISPKTSPTIGDEVEPFVQFKPWSDYPAITRDVAVWVLEGITAETVTHLITQYTGEYLVRGPRLFDTFSKDGKTSYAFRMVFQSFEKTLSESDITPIMDTIYTALSDAGYEIR